VRRRGLFTAGFGRRFDRGAAIFQYSKIATVQGSPEIPECEGIFIPHIALKFPTTAPAGHYRD
jgi:hypothetical protein